MNNGFRVENCGYVLRTNILLTNVNFFIQELEELRSDRALGINYPEMIPKVIDNMIQYTFDDVCDKNNLTSA